MSFCSQIYRVANPQSELFRLYCRAVRIIYNHFCYRLANSPPWVEYWEKKLSSKKDKDGNYPSINLHKDEFKKYTTQFSLSSIS